MDLLSTTVSVNQEDGTPVNFPEVIREQSL